MRIVTMCIVQRKCQFHFCCLHKVVQLRSWVKLKQQFLCLPFGKQSSFSKWHIFHKQMKWIFLLLMTIMSFCQVLSKDHTRARLNIQYSKSDSVNSIERFDPRLLLGALLGWSELWKFHEMGGQNGSYKL